MRIIFFLPIFTASAALISDLPPALLWNVMRKGRSCLLIAQNHALYHALRLSDPRDYAACHAVLSFTNTRAALKALSTACLPNTFAALYGFLRLSPRHSSLIPQAFVSSTLAQCTPVMTFLFEKGADINFGLDGKSPIELAVNANLTDVVLFLVDLGARADFSVLLGAAAKLGHLKVADTLLELAHDHRQQLNCAHALYGASITSRMEMLAKLVDRVECQDRNLFEMVAVCAAQSGHFEPIALLVSRGVSTLMALEKAAFYGTSELVKMIYDLKPIVPLPGSVLYNAVYGGNHKTVEFLIGLCTEDIRGYSLAFIPSDDPEMLCLIASRISDVKFGSLYVNTYVFAASRGYTNMLRIFLSRSHRDDCLLRANGSTGHFGHIDNLDVDVYNGSAMNAAAQALLMDAVKYLLTMGSIYYSSALFAAVKVRDLELARILVELPGVKASLGTFMMQGIVLQDRSLVAYCLGLGATYHGDTAFGFAVGTGDLTLFQMFSEGSDPMQLVRHTLEACKNGYLDIVKKLFEKMAANNISPSDTEISSMMDMAVGYGHEDVAAFFIDRGLNSDWYFYRMLHAAASTDLIASFLSATAHVPGLCYRLIRRAFDRDQITEEMFLPLLPQFIKCGITEAQLHYLAGRTPFFGFIRNQVESRADLIADGCRFGVLQGLKSQVSYSMALARAGCSVHQKLPGVLAGTYVIKLSYAITSFSFALKCLRCVRWALSPEVTPNLQFHKLWAANLAVKTDFVEGFLLLQEIAPLSLKQMADFKLLQKAVKLEARGMVAVLTKLGLVADSDTVQNDGNVKISSNKRLRLR